MVAFLFQDCPKALHDTMVECWLSDPKLRPTFVDLVQKIERLLQQSDLLHPNTHQDSKDMYVNYSTL